MPPQARRPGQHTAAGQDADALLRGTARGDERAFELLYDLASAPVHGLVRRVVRDPALAEEVTQEVMIEVWRTAARYDPARGAALAWIMTMAHRRAVDRVRHEAAAGESEARAARREPAAPLDPVTERVERRLEHERVRRCLRNLTPLQRETLTLAYYGGHSYREVAVLVGAPPNTVRTRIRDGIVRLRDCLGAGR
ncbi:ECF RNA polymerase sigma factor SigK [Actinomadura rubrisoli]|uniref:Sigma-70 family RNA polymerase sigma factor n=1 Tax=Actinomadura rubrisoli TaxID=2530368 RepID=A0A4R5B086_9ACTN|nr:ECF RNA polymerase sigma factor SigK [Actinomadura rubrisoli]TDD78961.1 sigma-70 family RNA polymerase sigma factor [Actinomadura rubrisoli]